MRRLLSEENLMLVLSLVIATTVWYYVASLRNPAEVASTRSYAVIPNIVGEPASGYSVLGARVAPSTVALSGNPAMLATIRTVVTEPVNVTGAIRDVVLEVDVDTPPGITASRRVSVTVQIAPALAVTLVRGVRVEVRNVPPGAVAEVDPRTIQVQVQGPISVVSRLGPQDFLARVDVNGDFQEGRRRVKVIIEAPRQIEVLAVMPAEVVVTVRKGG